MENDRYRLLVDIVFKTVELLDIARLNASKILIRVPLLNIQTKKINYVNPKGNQAFNLSKAAKSMPIIYGRCVYVDKNIFIDRAWIASVEKMIHEAELLGATHIIVIDNRVRNKVFEYVKKIISYFLSTRTDDKYQLISQNIFIQDNESRAWFATTKPKQLASMFDSGCFVAKNNSEVRDFLKKFSNL